MASRALTVEKFVQHEKRNFSSAKQPNSAVVKANPEKTALKQIDIARNDLLDQVKSRITEVQGFLEDDVVDSKDLGFTLSYKEGVTSLTRTVDDKEVKVSFRPVDAYIPEEGEEAPQEEGGERQETEEGEEGENEPSEQDLEQQFNSFENFLTMEVAITKGGERMVTICDIDVYGQIHATSYYFGDADPKNADHIEVSDNISVGIQEYLSKLGVNEDLVSFLWSYCRRHQDECEINRLNALKKFLE